MILKKRHFSANFLKRTQYIRCLDKTPINEKVILLESQRGATLHGNIFYFIKELQNNKDYSGYKVYVTVQKNKYEIFEKLLSEYNFDVHLIKVNTIKYYKVLSSAKYIITDTTFIVPFIKKEGQIILNVWHGTPLKGLGKNDKASYHAIGNVQKSFFLSDYLLYPSHYMMEHMTKDYMLENIATSKCLISGYPRNEALVAEKNEDILEKIRANDKEIIGYMPTWRGVVGGISKKKQAVYITYYLLEIEKGLSDNQILLVNLHPFVGDLLDFGLFRKIKPFPDNFETYEVLNVCDQLITDYSSVFFDYAITKKKIVLFAYDEEEYLSDRGLYLSLEELPFPIARTVNELIHLINEPKDYDEKEFLSTYCKYECKDATKKLLDNVILGKDNILTEDIKSNGKKNIIIYPGNLSKNGITTALTNLLNRIDLDKYNYYLTFSAKVVAKNKGVLKTLPDNVNYISTMGGINAGLFGKVAIVLSERIKFSANYNKGIFDKIYKNEIKRTLGNIEFSNAVQYSGYEMRRQMMFGRFDCNRVIYVHSNVVEEIITRNAQKPNMLRYAYNTYDKLALVTQDMTEPTLQFCNHKEKMHIANNIIDYTGVIEKSKLPFEFDKDTASTKEFEELEKILASEHKVFVNVGRFSPEKRHFDLIDAFDSMCQERTDTPYLIILGGHGAIYRDTLEYALEKQSGERIIIIRSMKNPFPLIAKCDYFVLSSSYEGFGLVIVEADILGLPVMSTDILGPKLFMENYGGLLVEQNVEGIKGGMVKMISGEIKQLNVDYEAWNKNAVIQFESLLE